ncbi:MAG: nucleotide exchange factor GrpE [Bacteroidota bacterium]
MEIDDTHQEIMDQEQGIDIDENNAEVDSSAEEHEEESEASESQIIQLEKELSEAKDKYIRLYAEFDNYKKRTVKERVDLISNAGREMITALLPVLDDFDRAKKSADDDSSQEVFSEGVSLVYNKLHGLMKSKGVEVMQSTGETFDPELHEAITEIPAPSEEMKGKIIDTIENGYTLNDKIIRHAKVVVGK